MHDEINLAAFLKALAKGLMGGKALPLSYVEIDV